MSTPVPPAPAAAPAMVETVAKPVPPVVRGAAAFLLLAGVAALFFAGRAIALADGVIPVIVGITLAINGIALCLLGWWPAVFGRAPRWWSAIILLFAVSVALEIIKRVL